MSARRPWVFLLPHQISLLRPKSLCTWQLSCSIGFSQIKGSLNKAIRCEKLLPRLFSGGWNSVFTDIVLYFYYVTLTCYQRLLEDIELVEGNWLHGNPSPVSVETPVPHSFQYKYCFSQDKVCRLGQPVFVLYLFNVALYIFTLLVVLLNWVLKLYRSIIEYIKRFFSWKFPSA